jgi:hypothetical protein
MLAFADDAALASLGDRHHTNGASYRCAEAEATRALTSQRVRVGVRLMSTDFRPLTPIRMADLFDGRLNDVGVHEQHSEDTTPNQKCLTDGRNFLWDYADEKGLVSILCKYGMNAPQRILQSICDKFNVDVVSEYDPEFWGFKTQEEWDAWQHAEAKKAEEDFYKNVVKFVRGEAHDIRPGTIGMIKAEIAKRLIADSPDLLAEDKRPDLIKAVNLMYDREHAVAVTLTDEELAFVRMAATHEDDLPQT